MNIQTIFRKIWSKSWVQITTYFFLFIFVLSIYSFYKSKSILNDKETILKLNLLQNNNIQNQKSMVLYFWATWCGVCKINSGLVNLYSESLKSINGPVFLSIVSESEPSDIKKFLIDHSIQYHVYKGNENLLKNFQIEGFPTFVFLNRNGKTVFYDVGVMNPLSFYLRILIMNFI